MSKKALWNVYVIAPGWLPDSSEPLLPRWLTTIEAKAWWLDEIAAQSVSAADFDTCAVRLARAVLGDADGLSAMVGKYAVTLARVKHVSFRAQCEMLGDLAASGNYAPKELRKIIKYLTCARYETA